MSSCKSPELREEGDDAYECRDGADNDEDGYFDCQDNGCWFSPDCNGPPGDADTDTDADADADADVDTDTDFPDCTEPICAFTEVEVSYVVTWTVWEQLTALGWESCTTTYLGAGDIVDAVNDRVSFEGTWSLAEHDCTGDMEGFVTQAIWVDPSGEAYHSFEFGTSSDQLDHWFAHRGAQGHSTTANNVFYITEMYVPLDPDATTPSAAWEFLESRGDLWMDIDHDFDVQFSK